MASPNSLRIINHNLVDLSTTTITASSSQSGSTGTTNLKKDTKNLVWRSSPNTLASNQVKAVLVVDLGTARAIGGVVLAFTNLNSDDANIRVIGYSSLPVLGGDLINNPTITGTQTLGYNTGLVACCPWNNLELPTWGTTPNTSSNYSYGGGTYARVWIPTAIKSTAIRYLTIEIIDKYDSLVTGKYIEVSRLIIGDYWSPKFNTGYGITADIKDMSEHERTEGGDLLTKRGPMYRCLGFNLDWLHSSDRKEMTKLLLSNGSSKPFLVSLFPDSTVDDESYHREYLHQIYGKMLQNPTITYSTYEFFSTKLELEEI